MLILCSLWILFVALQLLVHSIGLVHQLPGDDVARWCNVMRLATPPCSNLKKIAWQWSLLCPCQTMSLRTRNQPHPDASGGQDKNYYSTLTRCHIHYTHTVEPLNKGHIEFISIQMTPSVVPNRLVLYTYNTFVTSKKWTTSLKVTLQRKQEENNYIHALFIVIENWPVDLNRRNTNFAARALHHGC